MPAQQTTHAPSGDAAAGAVVARVRAAVAHALDADARDAHAGLVLAVSGGRDSMVLLDAALAVARERVRLVATYDHGTGEAARRAARHVRAAARAAGVPVRVGRRGAAANARATEAAWRADRWAFLRRAARSAMRDGERVDGERVLIATGHTEDDQIETVAMRVLRGAGARGLAGMFAPARGVVRPLLSVPAADVAAYAAARDLAWADDPSNASPRHLRNRVRHELLPALTRARPTLRADLLRVATAAAAWRRDVDDAAAALAVRCARDTAASLDDGRSVAALGDLVAYDADALGVLWPALLARAGVRADRRGTARLAAFTTRCVGRLADGRSPVGSAPVAGGVRVAVERRRGGGSPEWVMVVRRHPAHPSDEAPRAPVPLDAVGAWVTFGRWRFRLAPSDAHDTAFTAPAWRAEWRAWLPAGPAYTVRAWQPGDRWHAGPGGTARRVKRFLSDQHVPAADRAGWPVVVADAGNAGHAADAARGEIVWIPGVRRSDAAPARPGRPELLLLLCERTRERRPDADR